MLSAGGGLLAAAAQRDTETWAVHRWDRAEQGLKPETALRWEAHLDGEAPGLSADERVAATNELRRRAGSPGLRVTGLSAGGE